MLAILELVNRGGYKLKVNFILSENLLLDYQVNKIAKNFTDVSVAILSFEEQSRTQTHRFEFEEVAIV